jgi:hypothetical protein
VIGAISALWDNMGIFESMIKRDVQAKDSSHLILWAWRDFGSFDSLTLARVDLSYLRAFLLLLICIRCAAPFLTEILSDRIPRGMKNRILQPHRK